MGVSSCCTSRNPPSPEGFSPRIVRVTSQIPSKSPPPMNESWSTRFLKSEGAAELREVLEENFDTAPGDHAILKLERSSATLNAVRCRIRKHFSRDSQISKRQSRSSAGNSEEEIKRRKELKRLRDKRIREELHVDDNCYEDAESLLCVVPSENLLPIAYPNSPLLSPNTESQVDILTAIPHSEGLFRPSLPLPIPERETKISMPKMMESSFGTSLNLTRRHSSAHLWRPDVHLVTKQSLNHRRNSSISEMPPAPILRPQRLPSIADTPVRRTSWRLSFVSDQRASQLRGLIQESNSCSDMDMPILLEQRPSAIKYLRSQYKRESSEAVIDTPDHNCDLDILSPYPLLYEANDFGGVDGNIELPGASVHLYEMQISRRLASRGLYSPASSPQLSTSGESLTHQRWHSIASRRSRTSIATRSRHYKTSSSGAIESSGLNIWRNVVGNTALSVYPSENNGFQITSDYSRLNLSSHLISEETWQPVETERDNVAKVMMQHLDTSVAIPDTKVKALMTSLTVHANDFERKLTPNGSINASETASFRQRETELRRMEARFPDSMARECPLTPLSSKFREEFEVSFPGSQVKSSIFSGLQISRKSTRRNLPKTFDGATSSDLGSSRHTQGYGYSFVEQASVNCSSSGICPNTLSTGNTPNTQGSAVDLPIGSGKSSTAMWAKIINITQKQQAEKIGKALQLPDSGVSKHNNKPHHGLIDIKRLSAKWKGKQRSTFKEEDTRNNLVLPVNNAKEEDRDINADEVVMHDLKVNPGTRVGKEPILLQTQENQLEEVSTLPSRGRNHIQLSTSESWTRYPSYTRLERVGPAGHEEGVNAIDWAVQNRQDGEMGWLTDDLRSPLEKYQPRSLSSRISRRIRRSWYKFVAKTDSLNDSIAAHGRRSSINVGGTLEAPELEILATDDGLKELREVEEAAEAILGREERAERQFLSNGGDEEHLGFIHDFGDTTDVSFADPTFYADCIILPLSDDDDVKSTASKNRSTSQEPFQPVAMDDETFQKNKYGTWSGRERASRNFLGNLDLRRSTIDFTIELEKMEQYEKDRAIKSAEEAWEV